MQEVLSRMARYARSPVPILILGETGTGKELCARTIWELQGKDRAFVALNCAAILETLIDSELFGHERGAFTGAVQSRSGLLTQAHGGILFLDEISEMSQTTQAKLLRAIETGFFRPVGGERERRSEFRLLAATHVNLEQMVAQKRFRNDLLHRLGAVRIQMPPLRDHMEDLPVLVQHFLALYRTRNQGEGPTEVSDEALDFLMKTRWPGNVRQLRNVIEAAAASAGDRAVVTVEDVLEFFPTGEPELARVRAFPTLEEAVERAEARVILEALRRTRGSRKKAAQLLNVSEATFHRKLGALRAAGRLPALADKRTAERDQGDESSPTAEPPA